MGTSSVQKWMSHEIERLSSKWQRYKPAGSGYNRIHSVRLSKSVTHMLNNPLPPEDRLGKPTQRRSSQGAKGVLACSPAEWEEVSPNVRCPGMQEDSKNSQPPQFAYYRSCATRIT